MGCDPCSWLRPIVPITMASPTIGQPLFFFFTSSLSSNSFKPTTSISCSMANPTNSSPPSSTTGSTYSRRLQDPLSSSYDAFPEILRYWVEVQQPQPSQDRFTVATYNILGDRNASKHKDLYLNVPSDYIRWGYRKRVLFDELMALNPDIICLQEVDKYFDLRSIMQKAGYIGSYKRRTGDYVDGCATFWKPKKFRLLERESIEFKRFGLRDNVAQLSVFEADVQS